MTSYDFVDFQLIALNEELEADSASETERGGYCDICDIMMYSVVSETVFMFIRKIAFSAIILQPIFTKLSPLACV
jgi:hypothetical protein